jgi:hypothetical protein
MRCTRKRQGKAERNSPERSECTSGLAARRTQLCQGAVSAEARMADEGPLQLHPDGEAEGQIGITGRDPIWQETLPRPCDATAHWGVLRRLHEEPGRLHGESLRLGEALIDSPPR